MDDLIREDRLPVWAQRKLLNMRDEIAGLRQQVAILQTTGTGSGVVNCSNGKFQTPLPDRCRVSFFAGQARIELFVDTDGVLRLYSRGRLSIYPQSTNALQLESK